LHGIILAMAWPTLHGLRRDPLYAVYHAAKDRCENPNNPRYHCYGGRGIRFRFTSFPEFLAALGPRPDGLTLQRINNDGHYEPGNVCWATYKEQALNRRPKSDPGIKLSAVIAQQIRSLRSSGTSVKTLMYRFNVSRSLISAIMRGEIWR
jgi:hypothetical protein